MWISDRPVLEDDDLSHDPLAATDYQLCLTGIPDEISSDAEDGEDGAEGSGHRDCSSTDSDSASVSSHASSSNSSVPLDNSAEEYIEWLTDGCPDGDYSG